ncbi:MAG: hypothetical protein ACKO96_42885 [Flammeovirgaceae bacterium]
MTAQQEAERLRKEYGELAVKVVDEIIGNMMSGQVRNWQQVKSELQKPSKPDPYIEDVPELSKLVEKIREMMQNERPDLGYNQIKMSDLPPPEKFAKMRGVATKKRIQYQDAYEKYQTIVCPECNSDKVYLLKCKRR